MKEATEIMFLAFGEAIIFIVLFMSIHLGRKKNDFRYNWNRHAALIFVFILGAILVKFPKSYENGVYSIVFLSVSMVFYCKFTYSSSIYSAIVAVTLALIFMICIWIPAEAVKYIVISIFPGLQKLSVILYMIPNAIIWWWIFPSKKLFLFLNDQSWKTQIIVVFMVLSIFWLDVFYYLKKTIEPEMLIFFLIIILIDIAIGLDWQKNASFYHKREKDLQLQETYFPAYEDMISEIRAIQHSYDNHLCAILNMPLFIHNYEELVKKQKEYISEISNTDIKKYIKLLKIDDKILAGFLYHKIMQAKEMGVDIQVDIKESHTASFSSRGDIIEVVGILINNALETRSSENNQIYIELSNDEAHFFFCIKNKYQVLSLEELQRLFEKGYSTKIDSAKKRGFGLYNARRIVDSLNGTLSVENEIIRGFNYICFLINI